MIDYWLRYSDRLLEATWQHIQIVGTVMGIAILIASSVIVLFTRFPRLLKSSIYLFSVVYSIPSMALFALLIPVTGLGRTTAIVVLVIYCQYILLRSFNTALLEVDPLMIETATGMGMTSHQVFRKIQLPLAMKGLLAGIKIAAISTIGITTIAATINAGGLGTILFDGMRTASIVKLAWGTLLTASLCLLVNVILYVAERLLVPAEVGQTI